MLDFTEAELLSWFAPLRPPSRQNNWPPAVRPIERAPAVEPLLHELGAILSEPADKNAPSLAVALGAEPARQDLQIVLAQLGAARLLRLAERLGASPTEGTQLLAELSKGGTANSRALGSSLRALSARDKLTRMFGPGRLAELQSCAEAAIKFQENT